VSRRLHQSAQADGQVPGRATPRNFTSGNPSLISGAAGLHYQRSVRPEARAFKARASRRLRRYLTARASAGPHLRLGFRPAGSGRLALPVENHPNREGAAMTAAAKPLTGEPQILASYECDEGTRQLVGQRIKGAVALSDIPSRDEGKVYLVERRVACLDELNAIVADYCQLGQRLGRPPMQRDWIFE